MRRAALIVSLLLLAALPASAQSAAPQVVVVGVPGLVWSDVTAETMPRLHALTRTATVGSLSVRAAAGEVTRINDGWATFSAGNRARASLTLDELERIGLESTASGPINRSVAVIAQENDDLHFDAVIGALGGALQDRKVVAYAGHGASLAVSAPNGRIGGPGSFVSGSLPSVGPEGSAHDEAALTVVEVADRYYGGAATLAEVDRQIGRVDDAYPDEVTLLVLGVSDEATGPSRLHVALASGPGFRGGVLRSASTRRDGFVQLIDVAPTILDVLGIERPDRMVGQPWRRAAGELSLAELVDADRAADAHRRLVPPFFVVVVALQLLLYAATWLALRSRMAARRRARALRLAGIGTLAFVALPVATYLSHLAPWWRHGFGRLLLLVAAVDVVVVAVAVSGPWRRSAVGPPAAIAAVTAATLAVDLLTGARLQLSSLAGYSPVLAGRFTGIGNVGFAVLAASALLAAAALAVRQHSSRGRVGVVAAVGVGAVVVDGSPLWGSDFGGVLALVPAFAVLALLLTGRRVRWRSALLIAVGAAAAVTVFGLLDYARDADSRTHLGRFVAQLLDGDAATIVRRKLASNVELLTHSVLTGVVPLVVLGAAHVLLRPRPALRRVLEREPALRSGLVAVLVMAVVGALVNDSGVAVLSWALLLAVPFAVAVALRVTELDPPGASPEAP